MAYSTVETEIANPGQIINLLLGNPSRKKGKSMARLSPKQIKYFGTKAQKAALKRRRSSAGKKSFHKPRSKPRGNPSRKKKSFHARRTVPQVRDVNFLLGNAGRKKGRKNVAKSRKKSFKKAAGHSHRRNAGRNRSFHRPRRRGNPAVGKPMDWIKGGVGVLVGVGATRGLPQLLFASSNTGWTGYAMNAVAAIGTAWATHMLTKDPVLTFGVAAGGFGSLIARIVTDMTPFGSYVSSLSGVQGMGDYQFSNIVGTVPQRIVDWRQANYQVGWGGGSPAALPSGSPAAAMDSGRYSANV